MHFTSKEMYNFRENYKRFIVDAVLLLIMPLASDEETRNFITVIDLEKILCMAFVVQRSCRPFVARVMQHVGH